MIQAFPRLPQGFLGSRVGTADLEVAVIDGMPDIHATRSFAKHHQGHVFLNFFNEHQRGADKWDTKEMTVQMNRTEALDYSRRIIRDGKRVLPRRSRLVEEFARHLAADAKRLVEDEETGAQAISTIVG